MTDPMRERTNKLNRALERANALAEQWEGDLTLVTRSAAAGLFADLLDLNGWEQGDPPAPPLRLVVDGSQR